MSNDKQVEAWIYEFWDIVEKSPDSIKNSEYNQIRLEGFLMAKRSMQPIELPDSDDYFDKFETNIYGYESAVHEAITAAGYI